MANSGPRILLTGAAGLWGRATLAALLVRDARVRAFVQSGPDGERLRQSFPDQSNLEVLEGDIRDRSIVDRAVSGITMILHLAAVVSPFADDHPRLAYDVNVAGARTLIDAVRAIPNDQKPAVVMCGSVAELGDRRPPIHWARVGDPLAPAVYDDYAQTKIEAERLLVDSDLPRWTWLRQTGILYPGLASTRDPIITHSPLDGVLEWTSERNSANLLARIATEPTPGELWGRVHHIGDGAGWRLTNWEFQSRLLRTLGVRHPESWCERNWFATRNFHGSWFADSDRLERLVPYRIESLDDALVRCAKTAPRAARLAHLLPGALVRRFAMKPLVVSSPRGTLSWFADGADDRIAAYFGSRAAWEAIGGWNDYVPAVPSSVPVELDHGFDTTLPHEEWRMKDLREASSWRGGEILSEWAGEWGDRQRWRCAEGHEFTASPRLVLHAGHWCPVCVRFPRDYPRQAERNRFLAQVLRP